MTLPAQRTGLLARKLGMTFRSLRYRLKKLGLDDDNDPEEAEA